MGTNNIIAGFFSSLNSITIIAGMLSGLMAFFITPAEGQKRSLEFVVNQVLAGAAVPTGVALLICAFKPELLSKLEGANINVAVAGIVLMFISVRSIFSNR